MIYTVEIHENGDKITIEQDKNGKYKIVRYDNNAKLLIPDPDTYKSVTDAFRAYCINIDVPF